MLQIIITKGKGSDKKDAKIFSNIIGIAKTTFGKTGILPLPEKAIKVSMVRKKHFAGYYTGIRILIDPEHNVPFETKIAIEKYFSKSNKGANFEVIVEAPEREFCVKF